MRLLDIRFLASSVAAWGVLANGCSGDDPAATTTAADTVPQFQIVTASAGSLQAFAGDGLKLKVLSMSADGATADLPDGSVVTWTEPFVAQALPAASSDAASSSAAAATPVDPLPIATAEPTGAWIQNPGRPDVPPASILYVLDPGTVQNGTLAVTARISGVTLGTASGAIAVSPTPTGDWTKGATTYGENCAPCHGATANGTPVNPDGMTYTMDGLSYSYPAPALNAGPGHDASDPDWNAALLAVAARADVDNGGVTLRVPMPDWGALPSAVTGDLLTTQDFADIYAFLRTQAQ